MTPVSSGTLAQAAARIGLCTVALLIASRAGAQQIGSGATPDTARRGDVAALAGTVTDRTGIPIAYATIFLTDGSTSTLADEYGSFHLGALSPTMTTIGVRRIGYQPVYFDVELIAGSTIHIEARLAPIVTRIREVVVLDEPLSGALSRRGFYDRMQRFDGTFITPVELERRRPSMASQMLRGVGGVTLLADDRGQHTWPYGRGPLGYCLMLVFLDGVQVQGAIDALIPTSQVKAVEVYARRSVTPPEFLKSDDQCGAVAFWTRVD